MDDLEENTLFSETSIWKTAGQKVVPGTRKNNFFNWLFQLDDDSKSLHQKMVVSPNIH